MLLLSLSRASARFLDALPPKQYRQVVRKVVMLMADPRPSDAQQLRGYPYWRASAGEYRIVYDVAGGVLRVFVIGKRNDDEVYRRLG